MEPGLLLAYIALGLMAVVPIYFGSVAAVKAEVKRSNKAPDAGPDETEYFSFEDAKLFPIIGSMTLFGLYLLFTYFNKEYINYLLTAYFCILGVGALIKAGLAIARESTGWELKGEYKVEMFKNGKEILSQHFGWYHVFLLSVSTIIAAYYAVTKHWIVSNMYGEAFATSAIQLLNLDSFKTGVALLAGLFFYDVFWVFGTDVMVTVAKSFDAPIKVVWPKNIWELIEKGFGLWGETKGISFTMLGLGDIVIPGIFVALCLRFDYHLAARKKSKKKTQGTDFPKPYFTTCFIAYVLGLITTVVVMHTFQAAQPALLYLSPACTLSILGLAAYRGELKELFAYSTEPGKNEPPPNPSLDTEFLERKMSGDEAETSSSSPVSSPKRTRRRKTKKNAA